MAHLPNMLEDGGGSELLQSFCQVARQLDLASFVTDGCQPSSHILASSPLLARLVGGSHRTRQRQLSDLLENLAEAGDELGLSGAELKQADGGSIPVLLVRRPLGDVTVHVAWIVFEAKSSRGHQVAWMRQLAHELNNPLTSVLWKLDLVSRQLPRMASQPARLAELSRHLDEAHFGILRAVDLVRDFTKSVFSSGPRCEALDLKQVLQDTLYLMRSELERVATVVEDFAQTPPVSGNRSKLQQVFSNLLLNALQAVGEAQPPQDHRIRVAIWSEPPWVVASVEDTGIGISDALRDRIFDPFVTTRSKSGGSGLGLFISREIVESLGGRLEVESSPLRGSSFRVWLKGDTPGPDQAGPEASAVPRSGRRTLR